jgi:hypothetical protein
MVCVGSDSFNSVQVYSDDHILYDKTTFTEIDPPTEFKSNDKKVVKPNFNWKPGEIMTTIERYNYDITDDKWTLTHKEELATKGPSSDEYFYYDNENRLIRREIIKSEGEKYSFKTSYSTDDKGNTVVTEICDDIEQTYTKKVDIYNSSNKLIDHRMFVNDREIIGYYEDENCPIGTYRDEKNCYDIYVRMLDGMDESKIGATLTSGENYMKMVDFMDELIERGIDIDADIDYETLFKDFDYNTICFVHRMVDIASDMDIGVKYYNKNMDLLREINDVEHATRDIEYDKDGNEISNIYCRNNKVKSWLASTTIYLDEDIVKILGNL